MLETNKIYNTDCLDGMVLLPDCSVDMVLCDLPYGTTQCKWDKAIPMEDYAILNGKFVNLEQCQLAMFKAGWTYRETRQWWKDNSEQGLWNHYKRVVKPNGAIVLFSAQPFTTDLIQSNRKMFRYEIIWEKTQVAGFLNAKKMPLRTHENICVFYQKLPNYNPIMQPRKNQHKKIGSIRGNGGKAEQYQEFRKDGYEYIETGERYPTDVVHFSGWNGVLFGKTENATKHPTQKPVDLCEYLIKTFTNEGDTVLDNCAGSGTTGEACINTNRNYILMEKDPDIFQTAVERIGARQSQIRLCDCG